MKKTKLMKVLSLATVGVLLTGCSLDYNIYTREQFKAVNDKVLAVHKQDGYYYNHNFTVSYNVTSYDSNGNRSAGEQTTITYGADSYYEVGAEVKLSAFYQKGVYDYSSGSIDTVSEVAASVDAYKDSSSSTGSTFNEHTSIYDPVTKEFVETDLTEEYNNQWFNEAYVYLCRVTLDSLRNIYASPEVLASEYERTLATNESQEFLGRDVDNVYYYRNYVGSSYENAEKYAEYIYDDDEVTGVTIIYYTSGNILSQSINIVISYY